MPFKNPIVSGDVLVRTAIRSPDYVPGISGWIIRQDGAAEFNNVTVRGSVTLTDLFAGTPGGPSVEIDGNTGLITITGTTGRVMEIVPSNVTPMIRFYSQNKNVYAYINQAATSPGQDGHATLGLNSGQYIASDGITRTIRAWLNSAQNSGSFEVINANTQVAHGGYVIVKHDSAFIGYNSPTVNNYIAFNSSGVSVNAALSASNEVYGSVSVPGGSGVVTTESVSFPELAGTGAIRGFVTAISGSSAFKFASLTGVSSTGATVNVLRDNATATSIHYFLRREP